MARLAEKEPVHYCEVLIRTSPLQEQGWMLATARSRWSVSLGSEEQGGASTHLEAHLLMLDRVPVLTARKLGPTEWL